MSWIDQLNNDLIITTGDGKQYKPLWKKPSKSVTFNHTEFSFPKLGGSLVDRREPMGRRFPLEVYFVGPNHLGESEGFENSTKNRLPWKIDHPYYGFVIVQPIEINYDNTGDNITKININCIETITDTNPRIKVDPIESIKLQKIQLDALAETDLRATVEPKDINTMSDINKKSFDFMAPIITVPEEFTKALNGFNQANSYINRATTAPLMAMRGAIAVLSYPANLNASVKTRINTLTSTFSALRATVTGLTGVAGKQIYQSQGSALISSMCLSAVTPLIKDYTNGKRVLEISTTILNSYNAYLADLDLLQSINGGNTTSFVPSPDTIISLSNLVSYSLSNLYSVALNSRIEMSFITEKDTNLVLLTHRFYGLDANDNNIIELMENNNWGLNHILQIKKGTKVVYYI